MKLRQPVSQPLFAAVAHDLKNTLAGLILWCDALELLKPGLTEPVDDQASTLFRTVLERINTSVCRSANIVDDLLDISRLEAGHPLPFAAADVDLMAVVQDVLQSRPGSTDSGRVRLESIQAELWGWWDADRLGRVLENLVSNAIKYSPVNEPITVRVAERNVDGRPHAVVEVEDRGIGIPADELPHIFELFHRGHNVIETIPGNGLGLWISHAIVAHHGGSIALSSREGQGTTVTVYLPLSPAAAEPAGSSGRILEFRVGTGRLAPAESPAG